jgi:hypothetical protein
MRACCCAYDYVYTTDHLEVEAAQGAYKETIMESKEEP